MTITTKLHRSESVGPNLQSRLEALEAAMGVRLNLAKGQGRNLTTNSLSMSTRQNRLNRSGQGIQRSASSCDAENRPGPIIKRLKASSPNENLAVVRQPFLSSSIITTPSQSRETTPVKQYSSPMDVSSTRTSRSSITSSTSSNYRTPIGLSPSIIDQTLPKTKRFLFFGEKFSDEILKTNLFWIEDQEFDDETRTEIFLQFGSMEIYYQQQKLFFQKQKNHYKFASKTKLLIERSRFPLSIVKKDRLELL